MLQSRLLRIALTALLLIPALGGSSLAYVCEMNGKIQRNCCCDYDTRGTSDCPKLEKRGCCDVRSTGGEPVTKSTATGSSWQAPASVVLTSAIAGVTSSTAYSSLGECRALNATGPPIFLRNCTLLR
jgi:hypothetical protein